MVQGRKYGGVGKLVEILKGVDEMDLFRFAPRDRGGLCAGFFSLLLAQEHLHLPHDRERIRTVEHVSLPGCNRQE